MKVRNFCAVVQWVMSLLRSPSRTSRRSRQGLAKILFCEILPIADGHPGTPSSAPSGQSRESAKIWQEPRAFSFICRSRISAAIFRISDSTYLEGEEKSTHHLCARIFLYFHFGLLSLLDTLSLIPSLRKEGSNPGLLFAEIP